jgi:hypothetical protein
MPLLSVEGRIALRSRSVSSQEEADLSFGAGRNVAPSEAKARNDLGAISRQHCGGFQAGSRDEAHRMKTLRALMIAASVLGLLGVCGMAAVQMSASQNQTATYSNPQPFNSKGVALLQYRYLSDDQVKAHDILQIVALGAFAALLALIVVARLAKGRAHT